MSNVGSVGTAANPSFAGIQVTGLVALWQMAAIMNEAITSTQNSQTQTQALQESMTQAGLQWSTAFSNYLQAASSKVQGDSQGSNPNASLVSSDTASFNEINANAQSASSFSSGMTNAVSTALTSIVQAINIDLQNVQQGVQKLFDTMAQF